MVSDNSTGFTNKIARGIVLGLFLLSGAAALTYEVIWSKYLVLLFGSTVQAQTVVLAVFMLGLAMGSRLFGQWANQAARPLGTYGIIEVAIGVYGLLFVWFYEAGDRLFVALGAPLLSHPGRLLLLKGGLSLGLLLLPTLLMGGTLPVLAAWLQRSGMDSGRWSTRFYAVNTLGACLGAGLAGFWLVRHLGLGMTLCVAALGNLLIGLVAIIMGRGAVDAPASDPQPDPPPLREAASTPSLAPACALVAISGGASMGLEILASRALTLVFGASLQAFGTVLMAFILGIGLGSSLVSSPRLQRWNGPTVTASLFLLTAAWLGGLVMGVETWVSLYCTADSGLARNEVGYWFHLLVAATISLGILGLPAALLGSVLPLWIRSVQAEGKGLSNRVGRLLAWNTTGAVVGVLLAGFVLMPRIGLRGSIGAVGIVIGLTAAIVAGCTRRGVLTAIALATVAALSLVVQTGTEDWRYLMSMGLFRGRNDNLDVARVIALRKQHVQILFYEDAADATVSVEKGDGRMVDDVRWLRINGKADASTKGDLPTQYLLAHLPMLARPEGTDIFVLGYGSGITAGALLGYPIRSLTIAENCAPVLRASPCFEPWNRRVLADRRTRVWEEDARTVLKLESRRYDAIISEPSNPWMAGIGSVFSREFYRLAASRLKDGGIMAQWFHLYEMNDEIAAMVVRTFHQTFPHMEIWDTEKGDIVLLGSQKPWVSTPDTYRRVFALKAPADDLRQIGISFPEAVWARQLASQETAGAIPDVGLLQTDENPILEYDAPKAFYMNSTSKLLWNFDERGWQSALAHPRKQAVLGALPPEALKIIFAGNSSINKDLMTSLQSRLGNPPGSPDPSSGLRSPCIFAPKKAPANLIVCPAGASETLKRLLDAEKLIRQQPARWREGVDTIERVLQQHGGPATAEPVVWPPSLFTVTAIQACLARQDYRRAVELLRLGLKLDPRCAQLQYLGRILMRRTRSP